MFIHHKQCGNTGSFSTRIRIRLYMRRYNGTGYTQAYDEYISLYMKSSHDAMGCGVFCDDALRSVIISSPLG